MKNEKNLALVRARTHSLIHQAERHYEISLPDVEIQFDLRDKSAGMVRFPESGNPLIRYNSLLLAENRETFLAQTVPHEVAHIVARTLYGPLISPHGIEWKSVMHFFGAEGRRCHQYDTSRATARRLRLYVYRCDCSEHQLTSIRHNRIRTGQIYCCRSCGQPVRPCAPASRRWA